MALNAFLLGFRLLHVSAQMLRQRNMLDFGGSFPALTRAILQPHNAMQMAQWWEEQHLRVNWADVAGCAITNHDFALLTWIEQKPSCVPLSLTAPALLTLSEEHMRALALRVARRDLVPSHEVRLHTGSDDDVAMHRCHKWCLTHPREAVGYADIFAKALETRTAECKRLQIDHEAHEKEMEVEASLSEAKQRQVERDKAAQEEKMKKDASEAGGLREENERLRRENARLQPLERLRNAALVMAKRASDLLGVDQRTALLEYNLAAMPMPQAEGNGDADDDAPAPARAEFEESLIDLTAFGPGGGRGGGGRGGGAAASATALAARGGGGGRNQSSGHDGKEALPHPLNLRVPPPLPVPGSPSMPVRRLPGPASSPQARKPIVGSGRKRIVGTLPAGPAAKPTPGQTIGVARKALTPIVGGTPATKRARTVAPAPASASSAAAAPPGGRRLPSVPSLSPSGVAVPEALRPRTAVAAPSGVPAPRLPAVPVTPAAAVTATATVLPQRSAPTPGSNGSGSNSNGSGSGIHGAAPSHSQSSTGLSAFDDFSMQFIDPRHHQQIHDDEALARELAEQERQAEALRQAQAQLTAAADSAWAPAHEGDPFGLDDQAEGDEGEEGDY